MVQAISTTSFSIALNRAVSLIRKETAQRQIEMQTGILADPGLALGESVGQLSTLASNVGRLSSIVSANKLAEARLEATQTSLDAVKTGLGSLTEALGAGVQTNQLRSLAAEAARKSLAGFASAFNVSINGEHIFAGINSSTRPFGDETGLQAVAEVDAAFLAHFGFAKTDAAAVSITVVDFKAFLNSQVEPIFNGPAWETSITSAANEQIHARIGFGMTDSVSVTANETAVRNTFYASAIVAAFIDQPFNQGVVDELVVTSTEKSFEASQQLTDLEAKAGLMQSRVSVATERMSRLSDIFETAVSKQIAIDPYESGLRLNELLNTLESTILISQRIQNLSFVKLTR